jgi:hypothetical protein
MPLPPPLPPPLLDFYGMAQDPDMEWGYRLTGEQAKQLGDMGSLEDMYAFVRHTSTIMHGSKWIVDKCPDYAYNLKEVMSRAPGVPVLLMERDPESLLNSWLKVGEESMKTREEILRDFWGKHYKYEISIAEAQVAYPTRIHIMRQEDFLTRKGALQALKVAFLFLDLQWKDEYLSLDAFASKAERLGLHADECCYIEEVRSKQGWLHAANNPGLPLG